MLQYHEGGNSAVNNELCCNIMRDEILLSIMNGAAISWGGNSAVNNELCCNIMREEILLSIMNCAEVS